MPNRARAEALNARANELEKRGAIEEAVKLYERAAAICPAWTVPLYNLGLLFKKQRDWTKSMMYNRQAAEADPQNQAAWWNLGIAATALGRWKTARLAWRAFGIDVPDGEGPVDLPCGFGPVRLDPEGNAEIVWAYRIDPARAEIASIPLPESKHRWRDIVLNDGAPCGYRLHQGKEVPVFNELKLLSASNFATFIAHVSMKESNASTEQLAEVAAELGGCAEDWSRSIRLLCKACSEGRVHKEHDTQKAPPEGVHLVGIAAKSRAQAEKILSAWQTKAKGAQIDSLDEALAGGGG